MMHYTKVKDLNYNDLKNILILAYSFFISENPKDQEKAIEIAKQITDEYDVLFHMDSISPDILVAYSYICRMYIHPIMSMDRAKSILESLQRNK